MLIVLNLIFHVRENLYKSNKGSALWGTRFVAFNVLMLMSMKSPNLIFVHSNLFNVYFFLSYLSTLDVSLGFHIIKIFRYKFSC